MKLIEIKDAFLMDVGAPSPIVISNGNELFLTFYAAQEQESIISDLHERNTNNDTGVVVLKFKGCLKFEFGLPGNETIHGHPYSKLGIKSFSFYELENSSLVEELQRIERVHPYYNVDKWKSYNHYILTCMTICSSVLRGTLRLSGEILRFTSKLESP
jgi:hypothetical protein